MPKSRVQKKRTANEHMLQFRSFSFGGEDHSIYKEAMLDAAEQQAQQLPALVEQLYDVFRTATPESIITTIAFYGSQATRSDSGEIKQLNRDLEQPYESVLILHDENEPELLGSS